MQQQSTSFKSLLHGEVLQKGSIIDDYLTLEKKMPTEAVLVSSSVMFFCDVIDLQFEVSSKVLIDNSKFNSKF